MLVSGGKIAREFGVNSGVFALRNSTGSIENQVCKSGDLTLEPPVINGLFMSIENTCGFVLIISVR